MVQICAPVNTFFILASITPNMP